MKTSLFCAELDILKIVMTRAVNHLTQCVAWAQNRQERLKDSVSCRTVHAHRRDLYILYIASHTPMYFIRILCHQQTQWSIWSGPVILGAVQLILQIQNIFQLFCDGLRCSIQRKLVNKHNQRSLSSAAPGQLGSDLHADSIVIVF